MSPGTTVLACCVTGVAALTATCSAGPSGALRQQENGRRCGREHQHRDEDRPAPLLPKLSCAHRFLRATDGDGTASAVPSLPSI